MALLRTIGEITVYSGVILAGILPLRTCLGKRLSARLPATLDAAPAGILAKTDEDEIAWTRVSAADAQVVLADGLY